MSARVLLAGRVVTGSGDHRPGWVAIRDEGVVAAGPGTGPPHGGEVEGEAEVEDLGAVTLAPGLVDAHAHGGGGRDVTEGPEAALAVAAAHRRLGTTSLVASLVSDTVPALARQLGSLAPLAHAGDLAGLHLEGPWLSAAHRGAHDPARLAAPTDDDVETLVEAGEGALLMVTLAPELPGALAAVDRLVEYGITVAVGHTDATWEQVRAALDRGATVGTHLFNGMRPPHHREPGPAGALLGDPRAVVELVADGVHLHEAVIQLVTSGVGDDRWMLVSDAMAAAAAPDGDYLLGGLALEVHQRVARLRDGGAIAGSTLTLDAAVRHAVQVAGRPVAGAIRAASTTPARALGLDHLGDLAPGCRADLVVLDEDLEVTRVMSRGAWVHPSRAGDDVMTGP